MRRKRKFVYFSRKFGTFQADLCRFVPCRELQLQIINWIIFWFSRTYMGFLRQMSTPNNLKLVWKLCRHWYENYWVFMTNVYIISGPCINTKYQKLFSENILFVYLMLDKQFPVLVQNDIWYYMGSSTSRNLIAAKLKTSRNFRKFAKMSRKFRLFRRLFQGLIGLT